MLSKGESISIISVVNYAREIVLAYLRDQATAADDTEVAEAKRVALTGKNLWVLENIGHALNKSVNYEISEFRLAWKSTNSTYLALSIPLFICLIIYLLLTLTYYLIKTIKRFRQRVMHNKGLLSLVRHKVILQNKGMQNMISEGELRAMLE